ncbi:hypothetical protein TCAL_12853 [Tigriopus californicus]|uniref:Uncharacterized protein n=1 Tax=Tigriopus californicus TaxID=6832 RepID=A0A553PK97_TIGCA|nr:uncharacterized protein LOC131891218 [Tigriopus californicus]TRY78104.1 hypothetical protein TCAL_12853 [Tigriopus californicus]|eukprot:TCALIF_12853-PA protein Name:"Protein of unknown function" AED:0.00 eAED:0.00 QI:106/1/1/1/1/1/3/354/285
MMGAQKGFLLVFMVVALFIGNRGMAHPEAILLGENSKRPPYKHDLPFVPEAFRWDRPSIIEFTHNLAETDSMNDRVLDLLNREVANSTETFEDLTYNYAGKEKSGDNTTFFMKVNAQNCRDGRNNCRVRTCNLELEGSQLGELAMRKHSCGSAVVCYTCGEKPDQPCPIVDLLENTWTNERLNLKTCQKSGTVNVRQVRCLSEYSEVAGLRTYSRLGCGTTEEADGQTCQSDQNEYESSCTCAGALCNHPYKNLGRRRADDVQKSIRQLKAHFDKVTSSLQRPCS